MKKYPFILFIVVIIISFSACKKSNEDLQTASLNVYSPLTVGKYITYNLDSLIYINFGTSTVIRSYQVKYVTDAQITDNLGRPAYRIIRYIRNNPTAPWLSDATFMTVNTGNTLEFIENNYRFLKLHLPIRDNYSWKGNSYIDTYSLNSEVKYLDDWDYIYESVGVPQQVGSFTLDNCIVVNQRDEEIGNPLDPNSYSEINKSKEIYAPGIGMIYREFFHSEYQPPVPGLGGFFVTGSYGITLTMIDHN